MATRPVRMGDVVIEEDEDPLGPCWSAHFRLERPLSAAQGKDLLIAEHQTPGQVLDAAIKWAKDRGLEVFVEGQKFSVIRPGRVK